MLCGFNGASVVQRWAFLPLILSLYFLPSMLTCLLILQEVYFWVESVPGLEISLLSLLEVDDIPDGIEVLQDRVSSELDNTL